MKQPGFILEFMPRLKKVSDPELAAILTDTAELRLLEPFFVSEVMLKDVAAKFDLKLNSLLYKVNKWLDLGLIEVIREEPRKGRALKLYRATSDAFFVPFSLSSEIGLGDFLFHLAEKRERIFHRELARVLQPIAPDIGLTIALDSQNKLSVEIVDAKQRQETGDYPASHTAAFSLTEDLCLDYVTAKALQKDMLMLYQKYQQMQTPDAQRYMYRLGLAPIMSEETEP